MPTHKYSDTEREIIVLAAVWDLIGSMVHYGHFMKGHPDKEATLMFTTPEAAKMFIIMLVDLLALPTDGAFGWQRRPGVGSREATYLGDLLAITNAPTLGVDTGLLAAASSRFADWLDGSLTVPKVWLPSINRNGPVTVKRMTYLKICGNLTKHGFTRLGAMVKLMKSVLAENGTQITDGESYLLIPEFRQWFFDHVFVASATTIAWHLNEIRWGIFDYLQAAYKGAYRPTTVVSGAQMYEYTMPPNVNDQLARSMFWELMNEVRSRPYFPRFTVQSYLMREF